MLTPSLILFTGALAVIGVAAVRGLNDLPEILEVVDDSDAPSA